MLDPILTPSGGILLIKYMPPITKATLNINKKFVILCMLCMTKKEWFWSNKYRTTEEGRSGFFVSACCCSCVQFRSAVASLTLRYFPVYSVHMFFLCFVNVQAVGGDGEEHQEVVALEVIEVVIES